MCCGYEMGRGVEVFFGEEISVWSGRDEAYTVK